MFYDRVTAECNVTKIDKHDNNTATARSCVCGKSVVSHQTGSSKMICDLDLLTSKLVGKLRNITSILGFLKLFRQTGIMHNATL